MNLERLFTYLTQEKICAVHIIFPESIHTVEDCVRVSGYPIEQITKSIILIGREDETIVGLVQAQYRVSTKRVGELLDISPPAVATPEEALERTGYPVGGMPCLGYDAQLVVDSHIFNLEYFHTGGGTDRSLLRMTPHHLYQLDPVIGRIRK
jgi:prolyl-tRNA editing enzyme YbaK/EbsC (Cys-tRNA(Pro) deacylase)